MENGVQSHEFQPQHNPRDPPTMARNAQRKRPQWRWCISPPYVRPYYADGAPRLLCTVVQMMDNMKHRTKHRAPGVIGRLGFTIGFVALFRFAFGEWTANDSAVASGMILAGVIFYFDPPTVIKHDIFTIPMTWKERLARWFK
jgi:hypothetical protein